jgi:molybdate transport system substrate-binding protein
MTRARFAAATVGLFILHAVGSSFASEADIKLLLPGVLRSSVDVLIPEFEKSSGHKVRMEFGTGGALDDRIQKGEAADVAIIAAGQIEQLVTQGKIVSGTQAGIAKVGMGVGVRKGAPKPDISSVDALKRALLAARSIGHADPAGGAPSGVYATRLLASLDIAAMLKPKIKTFGSGPLVIAALAKGEVELALGPTTEIVAEPNAELAGSMPAPIQNYTQLAGGILVVSKQRDAGEALIGFLTSPAAKAVMRTKGFE